jgi:hypothetical protein
MASILPDTWTDKLEHALAAYDVSLLRAIGVRLLRARNQWPADDLRERIRDAVGNAPVVDRRLKELPPACRKLLALIGLSRRPDWKVGQMLEMLAALGHAEGPEPIQTLFDEGLLYPLHRTNGNRVRGFDYWLGNGSLAELRLFAHPQVTQRARLDELGLLTLPAVEPVRSEVREADGLEWPLRFAVAWQQVGDAPLRRTMQQDFFKRDVQRLRSDPLASAPWADHLADLPDPGLLSVAWAHGLGLLRERDGDLTAASFDDAWKEGHAPLIAAAWRQLLEVEGWCPARGWELGREGGNPFPSLYPLALAVLARQRASSWLRVGDVAGWLAEHHPYWGDRAKAGEWAEPILLGLFFQLKLVQAAPGPDGAWLIRLSPLGRWLAGAERVPPAATEFPQTLIVQPNFEVLVFRQGLTPALVSNLTRFARWKSLGAACTMELESERVYHGLESGLALDDIRLLLQRHGMRPVPDNVLDALRTWANKRDRIVVYNSATVIEFSTPADLDEALRRGLVEVKLTDRLALVRDEESLDYRQFRLTGRRDYGEQPERCLIVDVDGLTLTVDPGRADLLLETEIARLAEPIEPDGDLRRFRLTRASLQRALQGGWPLSEIDEWLTQRAGQPLSPAARLLAMPDETLQFQVESCLVLFAPTELLADALLQWPATRDLIRTRVGPTALAVTSENLPRLREAIEGLKQRLV